MLYNRSENVADALSSVENELERMISEYKGNNRRRPYLSTLATMASLERNLAVGRDMLKQKVKPTHLTDETFKKLDRVSDSLRQKKIEVENDAEMFIYTAAEGGAVAGAIASGSDGRDIQLLCEVFLARLYGFAGNDGYASREKNGDGVDGGNRVSGGNGGGSGIGNGVSAAMAARADTSMLESALHYNLSKEIVQYVYGVIYYADTRRIIESGSRGKLSRARRQGIKADNPWVMLARCEYADEHDGGFLSIGSYDGFNSALIASQERVCALDEHTRARVAFRLAAERCLDCGEWTDDIMLGFKTGVKRDADLAASIIVRFGKRCGNLPDDFRNCCKVASSHGYQAASFLSLYLLGETPESADDLYELFVCAQDDADCRYRYYKVHGRLAGRESELLQGDIADNTKIELFNSIKDKPEHIDKSYAIAADMWRGQKDAAIWLGLYEFERKSYAEAFNILSYAYNRLGAAGVAGVLSRCYIHGYGTAENYRLAYAVNRSLEGGQSVITQILYTAYGIGCVKRPHEALRRLERVSPPVPDAGFIWALVYSACVCDLRDGFWKRTWKWHDAEFGITFINAVESKLCFRPFIELICMDLAVKNTKGAVKYNRKIAESLSAAQNAIGRGLLLYFMKVGKFFGEESYPTFKERFIAIFSNECRRIMYAKLFRNFEMRLALAVECINTACGESHAAFSDYSWIPWIDELRATTEGYRLRWEAANADSWTASGLLAQSADMGDGAAALKLYASGDYPKKGKKALELLDTALQCNHAEAYLELAYLVENGERHLSPVDLFRLYKKAVAKGNKTAAVNAAAVFTHILRSPRKTKAIQKLARAAREEH